MISAVSLTRDPLQMVKADAIGYGAKDTGEMGGGAAAAVLAAAGPELLAELRSKMPVPPRRVGDVIATGAFRLQALGVRRILHIISIIKNTPQGAYCPEPARLRDGVFAALTESAKAGARSIAFSALGTGEGRVEPRDAARFMLEGVRAFRQGESGPRIEVIFALPSYRDYEAFSLVMQSA